MLALDFAIEAVENAHALAYLRDAEDAGLVAIVKVGRVVRDLVGQVDELGFERRSLVEQVVAEFGMRAGVVIVRVLDDTFAYLERKVQAAKADIPKLEVLNDAQRVQVVVEKPVVGLHGRMERFFAGVSKWWMADVMDKRECFDQVWIQAELLANGARNLRDLDGVRQSIPKVIGEATGEDLRLILQPPECARMDDSVPVALERVAVFMPGLGMLPPARIFDTHRVRSEHEDSFCAVSGRCKDSMIDDLTI
jgi:hypothetical protein